MRAKFLVKFEMISFRKEMQIHFAHDRAVAVRVVRDQLASIPPDDAQLINEVARPPRQDSLEETRGVQTIRLHVRFAAVSDNDADFLRIGPEERG